MRYLRSLGFSLVEMMVVIAIIGILVSLALPRFRTFIARTRMAEAVTNLGVIKTLQKSYNLHYQMLGQDDVHYNGILMGNGWWSSGSGRCGSAFLKNKLGFRVEDCTKLRYTYWSFQGNFTFLSVLSTPAHTVYPSGYHAGASNDGKGTHAIYPGCRDTGGGANFWQVADFWWLAFEGSAGLVHGLDVVETCE